MNQRRARAKNGEPQAFLLKAFELSPNECVEWPFGRLKSGYPSFNLNGKAAIASRLACEHANGPAPTDKHHAAHLCGNKVCVNPRHIVWADAEVNNAHKVAHGTNKAPSRRKIPVEDIPRIRSLIRRGAEMKRIGAIYGVTGNAIKKIAMGTTYNEIE